MVIDFCGVALVQVWITIQRPGVFYGQCSELCGANHAFMPIVVEAVTPRQFVQVSRSIAWACQVHVAAMAKERLGAADRLWSGALLP